MEVHQVLLDNKALGHFQYTIIISLILLVKILETLEGTF